MELSDYNGWENKFTWLVHLHLSNEERLANEITDLVAGEPNEGPAGRLVEMWVKSALSNWLTRFRGRNKQHDECMTFRHRHFRGRRLIELAEVKEG